MKPTSYVLFEHNGLVFETHVPDQQWSFAEEWGGRRVGENAPDVEEIALSLCFVLPPLVPEPGSYNVLTQCRCAGGEGSSGDRDAFLEVVYDAEQSVLRVGTGAETPLCLDGLESRLVAGRVLRLFVSFRQACMTAAELGRYRQCPTETTTEDS